MSVIRKIWIHEDFTVLGLSILGVSKTKKKIKMQSRMNRNLSDKKNLD
jgi:hypothetical protein